MKTFKKHKDPHLSADDSPPISHSIYSDRYIPLRSSSLTKLMEDESHSTNYLNLLKRFLSPTQKQLKYKSNPSLDSFQLSISEEPLQKAKPTFLEKPYKILEAPGLKDDFYL
jgi:hypothetical protein